METPWTVRSDINRHIAYLAWLIFFVADTVGEVGGELYSGALFPFSDGIRLSSPALIGLNETSVFLGYVKADLAQTALACKNYQKYFAHYFINFILFSDQTASIVPGPNSIELVLSSAASTSTT